MLFLERKNIYKSSRDKNIISKIMSKGLNIEKLNLEIGPKGGECFGQVDIHISYMHITVKLKTIGFHRWV